MFKYHGMKNLQKGYIYIYIFPCPAHIVGENLRLNHIAICNDLLALHFDSFFEMRQSLASFKQPTRSDHMWRIIIGHRTLLVMFVDL